MKIDIIIPNYNGSHLIENNLSKVILAHNNFDGRIILVDDGSQKEEKIQLRNLVRKINSPKLTLIEHSKNKGFSSAINTGVNESNAEFVVLLNSDVVPAANFLGVLVEKMKKDDLLFGLGCLDESVEKERVVMRGRGLGFWKKGMLLHKKGDVGSDDTFWISGGSCILRRAIFVKLNGMDELFNPFYWEDIDLSYRARKAGYHIGFCKESVVRHYHEEGAIKKGFSNFKITKIAYRNQFIFVWKNITSLHLLANHILFLPVNIVNAIKGGDSAFIYGFILAVLKLPAIIKKRNLQKDFNKVEDVRLLSKIS